jgi:hypothetical protein
VVVRLLVYVVFARRYRCFVMRKKEGLAVENVKARRAVGPGADWHVGDYQSCARVMRERMSSSKSDGKRARFARSFKFGARRPLA